MMERGLFSGNGAGGSMKEVSAQAASFHPESKAAFGRPGVCCIGVV